MGPVFAQSEGKYNVEKTRPQRNSTSREHGTTCSHEDATASCIYLLFSEKKSEGQIRCIVRQTEEQQETSCAFLAALS